MEIKRHEYSFDISYTLNGEKKVKGYDADKGHHFTSLGQAAEAYAEAKSLLAYHLREKEDDKVEITGVKFLRREVGEWEEVR